MICVGFFSLSERLHKHFERDKNVTASKSGATDEWAMV